MKIAMIGSGYVGLTTGACLADAGNVVVCMDKDEAKIDRLRDGRMPFYEPGLVEIVERSVGAGRLKFTTDLADAVTGAEVVFIAVGTPVGEGGSADTSQVENAARDSGAIIGKDTVIAVKSTVPPGTAGTLQGIVAARTLRRFSVVSNPEFLKEGTAVDDFMRPDRVVIGTRDDYAAEVMRDLYAPFTRTGAPILVMDPESAELSKYAANAMLAARISFMNEMANVCEHGGGNIDHIRRVLGTDKRIGASFLFAGAGYGGSCFPKDVKALAAHARSNGYRCGIVEAVEHVNDCQKIKMVGMAREHFGDLRGRRIAIWGLAFKPKTDDTREAPATTIAQRLIDDGAKVTTYDPEAVQDPNLDAQQVEDAYTAADGADALMIVTEWNEFRYPDLDRLQQSMATPVIFDGRNILQPNRMREAGFEYYSIGR